MALTREPGQFDLHESDTGIGGTAANPHSLLMTDRNANFQLVNARPSRQ